MHQGVLVYHNNAFYTFRLCRNLNVETQLFYVIKVCARI